MDFDKEVDARGLACPLPILRLKKALAEVPGGRIVRVLTTDRASIKDIEAFTNQTGHELMRQGEMPDNALEFFIRHK
ncbi:MAG: sulfurtransferase TusA family protein [Azoarcus sp.]|jgi:tRNA 2-thiouridine synthesizing protein A|nr:sulfurtransferase TusA family protein [Azoarcus sp.]